MRPLVILLFLCSAAFGQATIQPVPEDNCPALRRAWVDAKIQAVRQHIQEQAEARREEVKAELQEKLEEARQEIQEEAIARRDAIKKQIERNRLVQALRDKIQTEAITRNREEIESIRDRNWVRDRYPQNIRLQPPVVEAPPLPSVQYTPPSTSAPPAIFQGGCRSGRCFSGMALQLPSRVGYTVSKRLLGGYKLKPVLY